MGAGEDDKEEEKVVHDHGKDIMEVEDQPMKPESAAEEEKVPESLVPREAQVSEQPKLLFRLNPVFEDA